MGSQAIFKKYSSENKKVVAMLQQDMTGYTEGTKKAGKPEAVGVLTDNVDAGLTKFLKIIIDAVRSFPVFFIRIAVTDRICCFIVHHHQMGGV